MYSLLPTLLFFHCSFWEYSTAAQFLPTRGSSLSASRTTRTSRRSSPSRRPCGAQLPRVFVYVFTLPLYQTFFVINVINNICTRFIISFYVICAVIYCSFCCIYVWLDPGTYMIALVTRFRICRLGNTSLGSGLDRNSKKSQFNPPSWAMILSKSRAGLTLTS